MSVREWSKATSNYSRRLLHSGRQGAARGRASFLHGTELGPFLHQSVREALKPAAIGACIGVLGGYPGTRRHAARRAFTCGFVGCVLGFGVGVLWESRRLAVSVAEGALHDISRTRDDHWLEKHPIDYA